MKPSLTIGMPTFRDPLGVYHTCQNLGINHREAMRDVEIIVVDNAPGSPESQDVIRYLRSIDRRWNFRARYVPLEGDPSSSRPKQHVFEVAESDAVWVMDCHVHPESGVVQKVKDWHAVERNGLYHGPLVYDWLDQHESELRPVWAGNMWGVWHRDMRSLDPDGEPYPIWGQGMFCFTARREAWFAAGGFHPQMRGWGGEEGVIHEQFRAAGREVLCCPWFRAVHRFMNPGGPKDPRPIGDIARNFVLGLQRLGRSIEPVREHFVQTGKLNEREWERLVADPVGYRPHGQRRPPAQERPHGNGSVAIERKPHEAHNARQATQTSAGDVHTLDSLAAGVMKAGGPLAGLVNPLRMLAGQSVRVAAIVNAWEWEPILASGRPRELRVWQRAADRRHSLTHAAAQAEIENGQSRLSYFTTQRGPDAADERINLSDTDLLILDCARDGESLYRQFTKHLPRVTRRVLIHGINDNWTKPDNTGMDVAWERWRASNPEWHRVWIDTRGAGSILVSRDPSDFDHETGAGTQLHEILESLGITMRDDCQCRARIRQMNAWGPAACRERMSTIVGWMRDGQGKWGWADKLTAAALAVKTGLAFKLNPLDPFPDLVEEAIRRAEAKQAAERPAAMLMNDAPTV